LAPGQASVRAARFPAGRRRRAAARYTAAMTARGSRRPERALVALTALFSLAVVLGETFITPYIAGQGRGLAPVGAYVVAQFAAMTATFVAAPVLAPRLPSRVTLRAGVAGCLLAFAAVAALRAGPVPAGALLGLGLGAYWLGFYVLALGAVPGGERDRWSGAVGAADAAAQLAGPLAGATVVARFGFRPLFALAAALFAVVLGVAGAAPEASGGAGGGLAAAWRAYADRPAGRLLLAAFFALGLRDGVYLFLPALLVYLATDSPWYLGGFAALAALGGTAGFALVGAGAARAGRGGWAAAGGALALAAVPLLGPARPAPAALVAFGLVQAFAYPLVKAPAEAAALEVIAGLGGAPLDLTAVKEVVLNAARLLTAVGFLALVAVAPAGEARWSLVATAPFPAGVAVALAALGRPGSAAGPGQRR
jgi:YQGE family putative transporter